MAETPSFTPQRWAIFCKIIDNFGDIGVCWRLAKQLTNEYASTFEHPIRVTLFIDDFVNAQKIIPQLQLGIKNTCQQIAGVDILPFDMALHVPQATVVIETFNCGLPDDYIMRMAEQHACWINVDYLCAESWVADFHGKPSKHAIFNITKHYYFPGFIKATGGLLREKTLLNQRDSFNQSAHLYQLLAPFNRTLDADAINISLFNYNDANLPPFITALQYQLKPINLWLPKQPYLTALKCIFKDFKHTIGEVYSHNHINIFSLPFLSQSDYDKLLWACDLNFVRGEDSWIRAIWAGKPMVWQPYIQTENTHLKKLNAFLQTHYPQDNASDKDCATLMHKVHFAWSSTHNASDSPLNDTQNYAQVTTVWLQLLQQLPLLTVYHQARTHDCATVEDLASQLVRYCQKIFKNKV